MKVTQEAKTFETNTKAVSKNFVIGNAGKIISILRDKLYRHKVRTLVQEYMCNGRDAMREIGSKDRIHVTVPTTFESVFKVRDFGPGISPDRIENVFIQYGSSTKDTDNSQTGGFGIGAKSAWSYTESFTIVTFIDGVQRTYVAHIGANNDGRLDLIEECETKEPNGTEIQVAVQPKDIAEFKNSAFRAAYFWKEEEQPLFNLKAEQVLKHTEGVKINDLEVMKSDTIPYFIMPVYDHGLIIVIDGIPYVAGASLIEKIQPMKALVDLVKGRLIMHFNTGDVEVGASREEIADSIHSIKRLTDISENILKEVTKTIAAEFKKVKTPFEHFQTFKTLAKGYKLTNYNKFGEFEINYHGNLESELFALIKIDRCDVNAMDDKLDKSEMGSSRRRSYFSRVQLAEESFDKLYYVDTDENILVINNRIRTLCDQNGWSIVFTKREGQDKAFKKVIDALGAKPLSAFEPMKKERKAREAKPKVERTKQQFCIHDKSRYVNQATYITLDSNTQKWLYVERGSSEETLGLKEMSEYATAKGGWKVCALSKDAMKRVKDDKNFKPLAEWLKTVKVDSTDTKILKFEVSINTDKMQSLAKAQGIKDKFLVKMIEEYKTNVKQQNYTIPEVVRKQFGKVDEVEQFKVDDKELAKELKSRWPLLDNLGYELRNGGTKVMEEIVAYINAK
jgi:hypothetical protein